MRGIRRLLTSSVVLILIVTTLIMSPTIVASSGRARSPIRDERYASVSGTLSSRDGRYESTVSLEAARICQVDESAIKTCHPGFNLRIFQYDHQDDRVSFSGSLSDLPMGSAPPHQTVESFTVSINGQLKRAQFELRGTMFNSEDFFHATFPVTFSQHWIGSGPITRNDSNTTVQDDGRAANRSIRSTDRDARLTVEIHLDFPADYPAEDIDVSGAFGEGHLARVIFSRSTPAARLEDRH